MSLVFGANSTDRAEKTSATGVLDLTQKVVGTWILATSIAASMNIFSGRGLVSGLGPSLKMSSDTNGNWRYFENGGTNCNYQASANPLTTLKWFYVACVMDFAGTAHIYVGDLATIATEVATYSASTAGVTKTTESAGTITWGSQENSPSNPFKGNIDRGYYFAGTLALGLVRRLQFQQIPHATGFKGVWCMGVNGTGTVPDESGTGNALTVTGCTVGNGCPLPRLRRAA